MNQIQDANKVFESKQYVVYRHRDELQIFHKMKDRFNCVYHTQVYFETAAGILIDLLDALKAKEKQ